MPTEMSHSSCRERSPRRTDMFASDDEDSDDMFGMRDSTINKHDPESTTTGTSVERLLSSTDSRTDSSYSTASANPSILRNTSIGSTILQHGASELDWDDSDGYYKVAQGEFLSDRYQASDILGKGNFATVVKCVRTSTPKMAENGVATGEKNNIVCAVKIFRKFLRMSGDRETKIIERLHNRGGAPLSPRSNGSQHQQSPTNEKSFYGRSSSMASDDSRLTAANVTTLPTGSAMDLMSQYEQESAPSDSMLSSNFNHIVRLLDAFDFRGHRCLTLEHAPMTLKQAIKQFSRQGRGVSTGQVFEWGMNILSGLNHIHHNDIVHTNINPESIFLCRKSVLAASTVASATSAEDATLVAERIRKGDSPNTSGTNANLDASATWKPEQLMAKIGSFAAARELKSNGTVSWDSHSSDAEHIINRTPLRNYVAPEVILQAKSCDSRIDLWSVGCVVYEMQQGKPFVARAKSESTMTRNSSAVGTGSTRDSSALIHAHSTTTSCTNQDMDILESLQMKKGKLTAKIVKAGDVWKRFFDPQTMDFVRKEANAKFPKNPPCLRDEIVGTILGQKVAKLNSEQRGFAKNLMRIGDFVTNTTEVDPRKRPNVEAATSMLQILPIPSLTAHSTQVGK